MQVKDGFKLSLTGRFSLIIWISIKIFVDYRLSRYRRLLLSKIDYEEYISTLHVKHANTIFEAAIHLKGALIKVCQMISSRVDIFPDEYTNILSKVQDKVPPVGYQPIKQRIEEELGKPIDEIYDFFPEEPVASASLGQVHLAKLKGGDEVAVKVQYPNIGKIIAMDLKAIRIIVKPLKRSFRNINFDILISEVEKVFDEELNYIQEGKNADAFRKNFENDPRIIVPRVYWEYTRLRMLTLERAKGVKIFDLENMRKEGIDPKESAYLIVESYCKQILDYGFMHADPHPGNLFVKPGPAIIYVDFGMMKRITPVMREGIKKAALAAVDHDGYGLTQQLLKLGFLARGGDTSSVEEVIQYFMDKYGNMPSGDIKNLDISSIKQDLTYALHVYQSIQIPEDYILVGRGVSLLEGIIGKLAPDVNLLQVAGIYVKEFIYKGKKERISNIKDEFAKNLLNLARTPEKIDALITQMSRGRTNFVMEVKGMESLLKEMRSLRKQVGYGIGVIINLSIFVISTVNHLNQASWIFLFFTIFTGAFFIRELFR